jgi:hypothetical protein
LKRGLEKSIEWIELTLGSVRCRAAMLLQYKRVVSYLLSCPPTVKHREHQAEMNYCDLCDSLVREEDGERRSVICSLASNFLHLDYFSKYSMYGVFAVLYKAMGT